MFGLDTIKRLIWGDLEKDIVRRWASEKIRNEKEHEEFIEKCQDYPIFIHAYNMFLETYE